MSTFTSYPGTPGHQGLLRAVISSYEKDPRVRAVVLFGSLARGNWDAYSDIDCDVVVAEDVHVDPVCEARSLEGAFERAGQKVAFVIPMNDDAVDIQFCSLMQLSIRYHPLARTSPAIIQDMVVLAGELDHASIVSAGMGNRDGKPGELDELVDVLLRYAIVANTCIRRKQVWTTLEILHRMRNTLMDIFALTHGGERAYQFFDRMAPHVVQTKLAATLSSGDMASLRRSLTRLIEMLEMDLGSMGDNRVRLTQPHRLVLDVVREQSSADRGDA